MLLSLIMEKNAKLIALAGVKPLKLTAFASQVQKTGHGTSGPRLFLVQGTENANPLF